VEDRRVGSDFHKMIMEAHRSAESQALAGVVSSRVGGWRLDHQTLNVDGAGSGPERAHVPDAIPVTGSTGRDHRVDVAGYPSRRQRRGELWQLLHQAAAAWR
jgi:hypothetical protein